MWAVFRSRSRIALGSVKLRPMAPAPPLPAPPPVAAAPLATGTKDEEDAGWLLSPEATPWFAPPPAPANVAAARDALSVLGLQCLRRSSRLIRLCKEVWSQEVWSQEDGGLRFEV